jgi:two-component system alkaline phosphatase synthesis response regulator PhoP
MKPHRILIIEDEAGLRETLTDCLKAHRYEVGCAADGRSGLETATQDRFDLIILDVMLPAMDGFDVCLNLRDADVQTPILILTAKSDLGDKVSGLRYGADDYMTKPFEMDELVARVAALLRRASGSTAKNVYDIEGIQVDFKNSRIVKNGRMTDLSLREARLLRYFLEHQGQVLSRQELLRAVWGYNFAPLSRTVDVHVAWLRQKLEKNPRDPQLIFTVHGQGYRFGQSK